MSSKGLRPSRLSVKWCNDNQISPDQRIHNGGQLYKVLEDYASYVKGQEQITMDLMQIEMEQEDYQKACEYEERNPNFWTRIKQLLKGKANG